MSRAPSATEARALKLLGSGVAPHQVASAIGVTESYISQLVSNPDFAEQIAELRYANLVKHNTRDDKYNAMEDTLLDKLEDLVPLMHRPQELLRAIQVINGAKRRGSEMPETAVQKSSVVTLNMPVQVINRFTTNIHNQVVSAGQQDLLTIQSQELLKKVPEKQKMIPSNATRDQLKESKRHENSEFSRAADAAGGNP